jgi:hypothetical protein
MQASKQARAWARLRTAQQYMALVVDQSYAHLALAPTPFPTPFPTPSAPPPTPLTSPPAPPPTPLTSPSDAEAPPSNDERLIRLLMSETSRFVAALAAAVVFSAAAAVAAAAVAFVLL